MKRIFIILLSASFAYGLNGPFPHNTITSDYGPRNAGSGASAFHKGIDYGRPMGEPIPAVEAGEVDEILYQPRSGGYIVKIKSGPNDWSYMHLMERCNNGSLNTEFCNVILVDTQKVSNTKNALVLVFWRDKNRYIADKVLSSEGGKYVKKDGRYLTLAGTTQKCITQNNVSADETIGPVGSTGTSSGPHLHLGLAGGGQNPLFLIDDYTAVAPSPSGELQPKAGETVNRKKSYPIKIGLNNSANKDLDSVSIQLDNKTPMMFKYGGKTTRHDEEAKVVFYDTTGVWPGPGMGNDRFVYCVDLRNDNAGPHVIKCKAYTIKGCPYEKTIHFNLGGDFFVSYHEPLNEQPEIDPFLKKVKIEFSEPVDTSTINNGTIIFKPTLAKPFAKEYSNQDKTVNLILTDTSQSLRFSTKYEIKLKGDDIEDTSGIKLDGNDDQVPGGDYLFHFYTRKPKYDVDGSTRTIKRCQTISLKGKIENKEKVKLKYRFRHKGSNEYIYNDIKMTLNGFSQDTGGTYIRDVEVGGNKKDSFDLVTVVASIRARQNSKKLNFNVEVRDSIGYLNVTKECQLSATVDFGEGGGGGGSGPGRDQGIVITGGDDNWSISDPHYPAPWLIDDEADVGLLLEGYSESCGHLLGRYGIATVPVESESLLVLSNMDRSLSDLKVLVIPTNGLRSMENWPYFWQRIEEYVSNGGYLIVLDQPYGNLYSRLPGSPQGRGFEEDLSCTGMFTLLQENNPAVYGQRFKQCQYPTDGYFTWLPPGATKHAIRLLRGGAASTITYPYGAGRVFATTCYFDQAWGAGQATRESGWMFRDAITCGLFSEETFQTPEHQKFKPGESGLINIEIVRPGEPDTLALPCDNAKVALYTPCRKTWHQQEFTLSPPLMPGDTARLVVPFTAPQNDTFRGIWLAGYKLYTDTTQICSSGCAMPFSVADTLRWNPDGGRTVTPYYLTMYPESSPIINGDSMNYRITFGTAGQDTMTVYPVVYRFLFRQPPETLYVGNPTLIGPGIEGEDCYSRMVDPGDNPWMMLSLRRASDNQDVPGTFVYGASLIFGASVLGHVEVAEPDSNWKPGDRLGYKLKYQPNFTGRMLVQTEINQGGLYVFKTCTLDVVKNITSEMLDSLLIDSSWTPGSYLLKIYCDRIIRDTCKLGSQRLFLKNLRMPGYTVAAEYIPDSIGPGMDTSALFITISPSVRTTGPSWLRYKLYRPRPGADRLTIDSAVVALDSLYNGMSIDMPFAIPDSLRSFGFYNMEYVLNWGLDSLYGHNASKAEIEISSLFSKQAAGWGDTVVHVVRVRNKSPISLHNVPLIYLDAIYSCIMAELSNPNSYIWNDTTNLLNLEPYEDTLLYRYDYIEPGSRPGLRGLYSLVLSWPEAKSSYASYRVGGPLVCSATDTTHYLPGETVSLRLYNIGLAGCQVFVDDLRIEDPLGNATPLTGWSGFLSPREDTVFYRYIVPSRCYGDYNVKWTQRLVWGQDTAVKYESKKVFFYGLNASVSLSTTRPLYFPADSIGPQVRVANTGVLPLDHLLNLEIYKYGLEPTEFSFVPGSGSGRYQWPAYNPEDAPGCTLDVSGLRLLGHDRLYSQGGFWSWSGAKGEKHPDGKRSLFKLFKIEQARRQAKDGSTPKTELVQNLRLTGHQGKPWALIATDQRTFLIGPLPWLADSVDVSGLGSITGVCSDGGSFYLSSFDSGRVFKVGAGGAVQASWAAGDPVGCAFSGGRLYIADRAGGMVRAFSPQGESLFVFGAGRLNLPQEVLALEDGSLLVADMDSLKRFTAEGDDLPAFAAGRFSRMARGGDYVYGIEPDSSALRKYDLSGGLSETSGMIPWDIACAAETLYIGDIAGGGAWVEGESYLNYGKWKGMTGIQHYETGILPGVKYISSFRPQVSGPGSVEWRLRIEDYEVDTVNLSCDSLEGFDLETALNGHEQALGFSALLESPDGMGSPVISRLDLTAFSLILSDNPLWQDSIPVSLPANDSLSWQGMTPPLSDSGDFYLAGRMDLGQNQFLPGIARHQFSLSGWPLMAEIKTRYVDYWPGESVPALIVIHNRTESEAQNVRLLLKKNDAAVLDTLLPDISAQSCCSLSIVCSDTVDFLLRAEVSAPGLPQASSLKAVNVETPDCQLFLDCPDSAGVRPFTAVLGISNGWSRPVAGEIGWTWSKAMVADTLSLLPNVNKTLSQQVWITCDDTLRLKLPWMQEWEIERPITFNQRARVSADTLETSGSGMINFGYRVLNQGALLSSILRLALKDSSGQVLDSLSKPYMLAPQDTVMDFWQSAPGCGLFRMAWALLADSSDVVLDSASALVEIVPSGAVALDSLTLDKNSDSLGQAWVGLHARNRSAEPFAGSFMMESDIGYWRSDRTLLPQSTLELRFPITDPQEAGTKRFHACCLTSGDTAAVLSRLLKFSPILAVDSLPDSLETAIGDTVEFTASIKNLGNAISRDTLSVNLGDLVQQTTELSLASGQVHNEHCLGLVPEDLEDQTVLGFASLSSKFYPIKAKVSGYRLFVAAQLDKPYYQTGDTLALEIAAHNRNQRNSACFLTGVYYEEEQSNGFLLVGGMNRIDLSDPERLVGLSSDSSWYVSGLVDAGQFDSLRASCQPAGKGRREFLSDGNRNAGIELRHLAEDSIASGPWAEKLEAGRLIQFRLRPQPGDTVERVVFTRYSGGLPSDTTIERFDSLHVRKTLRWPFDPRQGTQSLLSYGVYTRTGRSLWLNTAYVYQGTDSFAVWPERQVYEPGDTAVIQIHTGFGGLFKYCICLPPLPDITDSLPLVSGDTSLHLILPQEQNAGTRYLDYRLAVGGDTANLISGILRFDVNGYRVRVHDCRLSSPTWRPGDSLTAWFRLHSSHTMDLSLSTRMSGAGGQSGPAETTSVALSQGYNWMEMTRAIPGSFGPGRAYLEFGLFKPGLDLGSLNFVYTVICPDTTLPSAWFIQCPANTYESQLPYPVLVHAEDDRQASDTLYYHAGTGWIGLIPEHKENAVSEFLIPPQSRGTIISYYVSITDGSGNRVRAPEHGFAQFHVLPALSPSEPAADTSGRAVVLSWQPPWGELVYHQYNPCIAETKPCAVRISPPYVPARLTSVGLWLERPDSTMLSVDFFDIDSAGLPGAALAPQIHLNGADSLPGWTSWILDTMGIEFGGDFYLGLDAGDRSLYGDGSPGAYRTLVLNGGGWQNNQDLGELCAHIGLRYPQAEVLYQVQRATADSAYRRLADSLMTLSYNDSTAGPEARHRYLVKSLWTQPNLYSSSLPIPIKVDWLGPRFGDSLAVLFQDSAVTVGAFIWDGMGVAADSIYTPYGFYAGGDSLSTTGLRWFSIPPVAIGDTTLFCILAWDSTGNPGRSPEVGWHQVVNTGVSGGPGAGLPTCFGLDKAFPNPSRSGAAIKYQLPIKTQVNLTVYNLAGQRVKILEEGMKQPGYYQARWDGRDGAGRKAAAGVYFYRLTAEGYQRTERLVMVR